MNDFDDDIDDNKEIAAKDEWKAVYDPNYDQYYYYNPLSDKVTWVLPKGAVVTQWIKPNGTPRDNNIETTPRDYNKRGADDASNTTNDDYSESDGPFNNNSNNSSNSHNNKKKKSKFKKRDKRSRLPLPKSRRVSESSAENTPDLEARGRAKTSSNDNSNSKRVPMRQQRRHRKARISSDDRPPNEILETPNKELNNKSSSDSKDDNSKKKIPKETSYERDDEKGGESLLQHSDDGPVVIKSSKKSQNIKKKNKPKEISGDSFDKIVIPDNGSENNKNKIIISSSVHKDDAKHKVENDDDMNFDKIILPSDNKSESAISSSINSDGEVATPSFEVEPGSPEYEEFDKHATVALDVLMGKNIHNISTEKNNILNNNQNKNNMNNNDSNNRSQMLRSGERSARRRTTTTIVDHEVGVHLLATGQTFFKYGNHSKPHLKFVSVDLQGNLTYVDALTQKKKPDIKGFHFSDVISILTGKQTKVFKQRGKNADESLCFSLVVKNRTLDLQAPTSSVRDTWVNVLTVYHARFNHQHPQSNKLVSIKSDPNIVAPSNNNKNSDKKSQTPQKKSAAFKPKMKPKRPLSREEKEKFQQMYRRVSVNRDKSMSFQPRSSRKTVSPDVHMVLNTLAGKNLPPGRLKRSASEQK